MSGEQQNEPNGKKNSGFNFNDSRIVLLFLVGLTSVLLFLFTFVGGSGGKNEIPYSQFLGYLDRGVVSSVHILENRKITGEIKNRPPRESHFLTTIPYYDDRLLERLSAKGVRITGGEAPVSLWAIFMQSLPWIFSFAFVWWIFRSAQGDGNRAFRFGRSRAKRYEGQKEVVTFEEVAGQAEAKYELQEVVSFLKAPRRFMEIGARIPKGVLLVGNPGTGKTLLARAVAGEAGVAFFHISGSSFVEMFVGIGASRVRDLFEQGKRSAPCIIFVDEIDAVGRTRGAGYGGGHDEREQTLNQLLVEMDGFETQSGVVVMAATNRPDVLDPALLRPGRFDRRVVVDMPDLREREAILRVHSKKIKISKDVDFSRIARATPGTSGADLANIANEAALFAAREQRQEVQMVDFEEAGDKVLMGVARRSRKFTEEEIKLTAYHEAGHALLHYSLAHIDPLRKVTIIPRGMALGVTFSLPETDRYASKRSWLLDRIKLCYGGYVAEELIFGEVTTGSQRDLEEATNIAKKMVCDWGMTEVVGPVSLGNKDEPIFIGKEIAQHKDYAEMTAERIDKEVRAILMDCLNEVRDIMNQKKDQLTLLAEALVEQETMGDAQVRSLLGLPPPNGGVSS